MESVEVISRLKQKENVIIIIYVDGKLLSYKYRII